MNKKKKCTLNFEVGYGAPCGPNMKCLPLGLGAAGLGLGALTLVGALATGLLIRDSLIAGRVSAASTHSWSLSPPSRSPAA